MVIAYNASFLACAQQMFTVVVDDYASQVWLVICTFEIVY